MFHQSIQWLGISLAEARRVARSLRSRRAPGHVSRGSSWEYTTAGACACGGVAAAVKAGAIEALLHGCVM